MSDKTFRKPDLSARPKLAYEDVFIPEWDTHVRVREFTALEREEWEKEATQATKEGGKEARGKNLDRITCRLVATTVIDPETGERWFTDDDVDALGRQSAKLIVRLFQTAIRLNAISEKDVEDLAGESDAGPKDASSSSSAGN